MDHAFTDEQTLLAESISRFLENDYDFEARQQLVRSARGYSEDNWRTFAELGWLGVPFPERAGGFGGNAVDSMLIMECFGRGLVVEPYLANVVLAGGMLNLAGNDNQQTGVLGSIIAGRTQAALAFVEPHSRFHLHAVQTKAVRTHEGYSLNGLKTMVLNGPSAQALVIAARTSGAYRDPEGVSLFVVDAHTKGLTKRDFPTIDGHRASEITLEDVRVDASALLGDEGQGLETLERVIDDAILAVGAEAVGCMEVLYKETVEYCKNRNQFGQPIGKFQVLQHRMVDMFMHYEQSKSLMYTAAMRLSEGYGPEAQHAVSAFKVQVGRSGRFIAQGAVQLHGGMGMTDELKIGHYFKRLTAIDALFGNGDHHLKRFGKLERTLAGAA